jgi:multiple sugar transport system substrate-binding protein
MLEKRTERQEVKIRTNNIFKASIAATALMVVLAGCSTASGAGSAPEKTAPKDLKGSISVWWSQSDREADEGRTALEGFHDLYPNVKVTYHDGQSDEQIAKAIATNGSIDVAISSGPDSLGTFCTSGAFVNLAPYMKRDKVDMSVFSGAAKEYTQLNGEQCSLPWLNNAYGLYYNSDLLASVGATTPPKTFSELEDLALKLTTYNPDGSIKTLGFNPLMGFYESLPPQWMGTVNASWMPKGKASFSTDPAWAKLMTWQKDFIDKVGYEKLKAFTAGLGDEWSANQAFETGQIAMMLDGEWRVAFIQDQAPGIAFKTAPMPTADDNTDAYGAGYVSGSTAGLSRASKNPEAAWAFLKYATMDTQSLVKAANSLKNMPSTEASRTSPDITLPEASQTFLHIVSNPHSVTATPALSGSAVGETVLKFMQEFQAGDGSNLKEGLKKVDSDIMNAIELSK